MRRCPWYRADWPNGRSPWPAPSGSTTSWRRRWASWPRLRTGTGPWSVRRVARRSGGTPPGPRPVAVNRQGGGAAVAGVAEHALERVRGVPAYRPGRPSPGPMAGKLSSNEAALGPSPEVLAGHGRGAGDGQSLPRARRLPSTYWPGTSGWRPTGSSLPTGATSCATWWRTCCSARAGWRWSGDPCYQIDATASLLSGATLRRVPLLADGGHDLEAMARASVGASVVWLPSPHNPTGVACDPVSWTASWMRCPRTAWWYWTRLTAPSRTRS